MKLTEEGVIRIFQKNVYAFTRDTCYLKEKESSFRGICGDWVRQINPPRSCLFYKYAEIAHGTKWTERNHIVEKLLLLLRACGFVGWEGNLTVNTKIKRL